MKKLPLISFLANILGRKGDSIPAQSLLGEWGAVSLNGRSLQSEGFNWVKIVFSDGKVEIQTHLKSLSNLKTISRGTWTIANDRITVDYGEGGKNVVRVSLKDGVLTLTPDILLQDKRVSCYRRGQTDSAQRGYCASPQSQSS